MNQNPFQVLSDQISELENRITLKVESLIKESQKEKVTSKEWLTAKEVCEILKISHTTLHAWAENDRIQKYKSGTRVRFKRNEVLAVFQKLESRKAVR